MFSVCECCSHFFCSAYVPASGVGLELGPIQVWLNTVCGLGAQHQLEKCCKAKRGGSRDVNGAQSLPLILCQGRKWARRMVNRKRCKFLQPFRMHGSATWQSNVACNATRGQGRVGLRLQWIWPPAHTAMRHFNFSFNNAPNWNITAVKCPPDGTLRLPVYNGTFTRALVRGPLKNTW